MKLAGAPITWGVCEVPGWGYQLDPEIVLGEMSSLGLEATELGPEGFLPHEPGRLRKLVDRHGLALVGGFVPVVMHDADRVEANVAAALRQADLLAAAGAEVLVLAAASGVSGYDTNRRLSDHEWQVLATTLSRMAAAAAERGLVATLHPHVGTMIETPADIERLLNTSDVPLCLDTGHVAVGGGDPAALAEGAADRIRHVHLKDVDLEVASRLRAGEIGYREAVAGGLYRPLGEGDIDVRRIIDSLERAGYRGWYVLEQDMVLSGPTEMPTPGRVATARSMAFLYQAERSSQIGRQTADPTGSAHKPRRR